MEEKFDSPTNSSTKSIAIFLLIFTTVLWGSSFIITKNIIKDFPVFLYLGIRFLFALLIFTPFLMKIRKMNRKVIWVGFLAGIIYFLSIAVQTIGLQTTTAGKGGFITGLNTVFVPFMAFLLFKKPLKARIWIAVGLSVLGMAFLFLESESGITIGDIFVLFCAFGFALYIVLVDRDVKYVDIYLYLIVQLIVITFLCFVVSLFLHESSNLTSVDISFWYILIYMGCIASGITFLTQNWGQKQVGPAQTAIIFTLEPVFAVLFGVWIGNEYLSWQALIGFGLIFVAIFITVFKNEELMKKEVEKRD